MSNHFCISYALRDTKKNQHTQYQYDNGEFTVLLLWIYVLRVSFLLYNIYILRNGERNRWIEVNEIDELLLWIWRGPNLFLFHAQRALILTLICSLSRSFSLAKNIILFIREECVCLLSLLWPCCVDRRATDCCDGFAKCAPIILHSKTLKAVARAHAHKHIHAKQCTYNNNNNNCMRSVCLYAYGRAYSKDTCWRFKGV